jgi:hypothetical protein
MSSFLLISSCNYIAKTKGFGGAEKDRILRVHRIRCPYGCGGEERSVALHLFFDTVRQFLDLFGLLDDFQRKRVFA